MGTLFYRISATCSSFRGRPFRRVTSRFDVRIHRLSINIITILCLLQTCIIDTETVIFPTRTNVGRYRTAANKIRFCRTNILKCIIFLLLLLLSNMWYENIRICRDIDYYYYNYFLNR